MPGQKNKWYRVVSLDTGWIGKLYGDHEIRPGFQVWELASSCGSDTIVTTTAHLNAMEKCRLDAIALGAEGVHVECCDRSPKHNAAQYNGKQTDSTHQFGNAWDSWPVPKGVVSQQQWIDILKKNGYEFTYAVTKTSVHADMRMREGVFK